MYDMALRKSYNTETVLVSFRRYLSTHIPLLLPFLLLISNKSVTNTKSKESHAEYRETRITHQHSPVSSFPSHSEVWDYLPYLHLNPHPFPYRGAYETLDRDLSFRGGLLVWFEIEVSCRMLLFFEAT
jgi:hypothetical protein